MIRPSVDRTIELMKKLSEVDNPDFEMMDLLAVAEYVNFDHQSIGDEYSDKLGWGECETCGTRWPCTPWIRLEVALTEWLIKAVNRGIACMQSIS